METSEIIPTEGFHGTYRENLDSIINTGFKDSIDHHMWFGDGCYFFVHGIGEPQKAALQYAADKAYREKREEEACCVLKATIQVKNDNYLDLTTVIGLEILNSYRDEVIERFLEFGKKFEKAPDDHHVIQDMRENLEIEFVKGYVNIKFGKVGKIHFKTSIPNITIFVVTNATKNIDRASIICL